MHGGAAQALFGGSLNTAGLLLGGTAMFTGNPLSGALALSLSTHGMLLSDSNPLSLFLSASGIIVGGTGFFTGNPFLMGVGISLSAHGLLLDMPSPFGNLEAESAPQTYDTEIN